MNMFCYQCEQTTKGSGCTAFGVCGKDPKTASLQDLLVHGLKAMSWYAHEAGNMGLKDRELDRFAADVLFTTVTNVNFDPDRLADLYRTLVENTTKAEKLYKEACSKSGSTPKELPSSLSDLPRDGSTEELAEAGRKAGIDLRMKELGEEITGLQELLTYGLKGMAAYAHHAYILGEEDDSVYSFIHEALHDLALSEQKPEHLLNLCMKCGEANLKTMEILDRAHTTTYGHPEPTQVRIEPVKGKAILVSGHDLKDLEELLKQTEGTGINIYTHGEMLPAHGYPGLKKYKHLVGNYGGAWQDQVKEFDAFPGAILMTTNCIQKPRDSYKNRIFTSGLVAWPGVKHVHRSDFAPVIDAALKADGFTEDGPDRKIWVGFGHNAVLSVADKVIDAVKSGKIKHFFLIGGCDGAKPGRNYYTELASRVPKDCMILTLACGKYRFNKMDFGDIGGIPRLLDMGQCNDAYSAVKVALALADAFDTDVNSLPLSLVLSWYEQKAVCILLTLLHLGIKDIRLGPTLPAFVPPSTLKLLSEKFGLKPTKDVETDLKDMLES